jgi:hypothetical protein
MRKCLPLVFVLLWSAYAQAQSNNFSWTRTQTGTGSELVKDVVLSQDHYVYALGAFNSASLPIGGTTLTNGGGFDIFVAKYDTVGTLIWAKRYGSATNDTATAITADSLGNVYVTGICGASANFGAASLATGGIFILKINATGNEAWAIHAASNVEPLGIASDPAGNTVICGNFIGTAQLGAVTISSTAGKYNGFVAQFSNTGTFNWYKRFYSSTNDFCEAITVASDGHIGIGGQTFSSTKLYVGNGSTKDSLQCTYYSTGPNARVGAGAFICKLQSNGSFVWGKENFSNNEPKSYAHLSDATANANGEFYFGMVRSDNGLSFSSHQSSVIKFSATGTVLWSVPLSSMFFNNPLYNYRHFRPVVAVNNNRVFAADKKEVRNASGYFISHYAITAFYDNGDTIWTTPPSLTIQALSLCASGPSVFAGGVNNTDGFLAGMPNINAVNVAPLVISAAATDKTTCASSNMALVPEMVVRGGVFPYTYQWTPAAGLSSATVANPTVSTATVGTTQYTVTITDALGTIKRDTMLLTVQPQLTKPTISLIDRSATSQPDVLVCNVPDSGANMRYLWYSTAVNYGTITYTPQFTISAAANRYWVKTYREGITSCQSATSEIFYYKTVKANAGRDTAVCAGQPITLGGTPPYFGTPVGNVSYNWFSPTAGYAGPSTSSPYVSIQPTVTADYILVITDQSGQTKLNDTVRITVNPTPNLGADTIITHLCANETTNLPQLYNTTGLNALWNTATPTLAPPGNYRLIATSGAGCGTDTVVVNIVLEVATWLGTQSGDWHTAGNWSNNKVPMALTHVIINSGTPHPCTIGSANATAASLQLRNGATLNMANGMTIAIMGNCATLPQ